MERLPEYRIGKNTFRVLFQNLIRPLTPDERSRLKASIKANGMLDAVTVDDEFGVIDGANRLSIASELGLIDVPWSVSKAKSKDAKVKECKELNLTRRHMTAEELQEARGKRIERVVEAREEGKSTREIANEVGVTQAQVVRDLRESEKRSGETYVSPDTNPNVETINGKSDSTIPPEKKDHKKQTISGRDGKAYSAKKSGKPIFDDRIIASLLGKMVRAIDGQFAVDSLHTLDGHHPDNQLTVASTVPANQRLVADPAPVVIHRRWKR